MIYLQCRVQGKLIRALLPGADADRAAQAARTHGDWQVLQGCWDPRQRKHVPPPEADGAVDVMPGDLPAEEDLLS